MGSEVRVPIKISNKLLRSGKMFETLQKTLEKAFRESVLLIEGKVALRTPVNTGALRQSITSKVVVRDKVITGIVGSPLKYAVPLSEGAKPHRPPLAPLMLWVQQTGRTARGKKKRAAGLMRAALSIQKAIAKRGIKARKFFSLGFKDAEPVVKRILEEGLKKGLGGAK